MAWSRSYSISYLKNLEILTTRSSLFFGDVSRYAGLSSLLLGSQHYKSGHKARPEVRLTLCEFYASLLLYVFYVPTGSSFEQWIVTVFPSGDRITVYFFSIEITSFKDFVFIGFTSK